MVRLGSAYGGWIVPESCLEREGFAILAGVGEDTTFEEALLERSKLRLLSVDPTPRAETHIARQPLHDRWSFRPVGLWSTCGVQRFYAPKNESHVSHSIANLQQTEQYFDAECRTLVELLKASNEEGLDLLKIDIEGAEFEVLQNMTDTQVIPLVLCVEFDQPCSVRRISSEVRRLGRHGYRVVAIDGWNLTFLMGL